MTILKVLITLAALLTLSFALLLHRDSVQLVEFLVLMIPAYFCLFILAIFKKTLLSPQKRIAKRLILWLIATIFVLNLSGVALIYIFSQDGSFNDWKFGHLQSDNPESFCTLTKDELMPVAVQNVDAINEAREILLPLRQVIIESSQAHDISPNAVAAFILVNRMIREGYPTYDFHNAVSHLSWHLRIFPGQKVMSDSSPFYRTELGRQFMRILPDNIRLQDRAADFLGGIVLGTSSTMGNMQVKASPVPGFEEEKNVRGHNLWKRLDVNISNLSDRQINWMLLTDPLMDIEAGTAALKQSLDELAVMQNQGQIISDVDLSSVMDNDWLRIFAEINNNRSDSASRDGTSRPLHSHDFTNFFRLSSKDRHRLNFVEFYIIAIQSGVFNDTPGIIVNVTTPKQVEYLREFKSNDKYLNDAVKKYLSEQSKSTENHNRNY